MQISKNTVYHVDVMAGRPPSKEAPPFGRKLAHARKRKGWSQTELAHHLSVTRSLIDYYERRAQNPTIDFVTRAAEALGVSPAELLEEGSVTKKKPGPASRLEQQIDELRRLPKSKQKFVSEFLDTFLQQSAS
jgi:transcriptional regulator with XRE-family HTH domain